LRHGAKSAGLPIRSDGYVDVKILLFHRSLRGIDFAKLETIVHKDQKSRYHLLNEALPGEPESWWIRANQALCQSVLVTLLLNAASTSFQEISIETYHLMNAWRAIGKCSSWHLTFLKSFPGYFSLGMHISSQVLGFIHAGRALDTDIKFYLSRNGVVLTPGNDKGFLKPRFFSQVKHA
ncbi:phosphotransferase KptA/Tpt1, partial [Mycena capillaripes]